ncbi:MAG: hypothetical protein WC734_02600 [Patescibacteria group bacterium]
MDEGVYVVLALGQKGGRVSATRQELQRAKSNFQETIRRSWGEPDVDVEQAWQALMADDARLGRE